MLTLAFQTLTTSLVMSLVGLMEGIPFVITLAITYWNKKMLSDKAIAQEPLACLTMASVTTIMNAAGLLITLLTTICFGYSSITSVQLLWANFVVALLGGLALLTEPPTETLMEMLTMRRTEPLITKPMWRNLVSQVLYQVAILLAFQFKGQAILHIEEKVSKTIIFNSFVLCQVFNQVNARELEKKNAFRGIHRNILFWVAVGVTLVLQVAFIEIAHIVSGCARLNLVQWLVCLPIGVVSWTIDCTTKCTSGCIRDWLIAPINSHMGVNSMTLSAPSEPTSNLELPLINENSTPVSS